MTPGPSLNAPSKSRPSQGHASTHLPVCHGQARPKRGKVSPPRQGSITPSRALTAHSLRAWRGPAGRSGARG